MKHADIDELTLWDVQEQGEYWLEHPPVHILVAAFVGHHNKDEATPTQIPSDFWAAPATQIPQLPGVQAGDALAGYPEPVFDFDELMRMRPN